MFKLKTLITPIAVCITLALANQAFAKPGHGRSNHIMAKVFSQLSLTDIQKQDIKQIFKQAREDHNATGSDFKTVKQHLATHVHSSVWDQAAVEAVLLQNQTQMAQAGLQRAQNKHAVLNLLTDEQRTKFSHLTANGVGAERGEKLRQHKAKAKGKRDRKGEKLGLSAEQTAAMASLKNKNKNSAAPLIERLKAFKQAERALITSTEFTPENWLLLNEKYKDDFLAMAVLKAKGKHDMWNVLTVEQQETLSSKMDKRKGRSKSQRHKNA
jgi:protein CpxP